MGPTNSDSVATLEKKFGKTFSWVCNGIFKKTSQKSGILIKTVILTKKKNKFSVFKQKLVIQYNHIKYSTSF